MRPSLLQMDVTLAPVEKTEASHVQRRLAPRFVVVTHPLLTNALLTSIVTTPSAQSVASLTRLGSAPKKVVPTVPRSTNPSVVVTTKHTAAPATPALLACLSNTKVSVKRQEPVKVLMEKPTKRVTAFPLEMVVTLVVAEKMVALSVHKSPAPKTAPLLTVVSTRMGPPSNKGVAVENVATAKSHGVQTPPVPHLSVEHVVVSAAHSASSVSSPKVNVVALIKAEHVHPSTKMASAPPISNLSVGVTAKPTTTSVKRRSPVCLLTTMDSVRALATVNTTERLTNKVTPSPLLMAVTHVAVVPMDWLHVPKKLAPRSVVGSSAHSAPKANTATIPPLQTADALTQQGSVHHSPALSALPSTRLSVDVMARRTAATATQARLVSLSITRASAKVLEAVLTMAKRINQAKPSPLQMVVTPVSVTQVVRSSAPRSPAPKSVEHVAVYNAHLMSSANSPKEFAPTPQISTLVPVRRSTKVASALRSPSLSVDVMAKLTSTTVKPPTLASISQVKVPVKRLNPLEAKDMA